MQETFRDMHISRKQSLQACIPKHQRTSKAYRKGTESRTSAANCFDCRNSYSNDHNKYIILTFMLHAGALKVYIF
jgi:hypothetical protein